MERKESGYHSLTPRKRRTQSALWRLLGSVLATTWLAAPSFAQNEITAAPSPNAGDFTIYWETPIDYRMLERPAGSSTWTVIGTATGNSHPVTNKSTGTYEYRRQRCQFDGKRPGCRDFYSNIVTVVVDEGLQACTLLGSSFNLVRMDSCGDLYYATYLNRDDTVTGNRNTIPDFSHAGYRQGGVAIPHVPEKVRVPLGSGNRTAAIQSAIDTVASLPPNSQGFRGAVVLEKGIYRVDGTLVIDASGVVLRGQGQHLSGTILVSGATTKITVIRVAAPANGLCADDHPADPLCVDESRIARIGTDFAGVGTNSLFVDDGTGFNVGDVIVVRKTPNQDWIHVLGMDLLEGMPSSEPDDRNWQPENYRTLHERRIVHRSGGHILIDIPLVDSFYAAYGGGEIVRADTSDRIRKSGVEDLRIIASYRGGVDDEDHAWNAIMLSGVENGWVRRVTAQNFGYSAVRARHSSFITVEDTANLNPISKIQGSRRYPFLVEGNGVGVLFQRVFSDKGRHNFVTHARVVGPHVWLDSVASGSLANDGPHHDDGPHHRWATGLLFDSLLTRWLAVENTTTGGTGHGWKGGQVLFWRSFVTKDYVLQAAPTSMNWAIGMSGPRAPGPDSPTFGEGIALGADAGQPRSLYLQQLENRAGSAAVNKVTTAPQRAGRARTIMSLLRTAPPAWADPSCGNGILSSDGKACCPLSCGACGGSGCSSRPGGAQSCCVGTIQSAGRSCLEQGAPCNVEKVPPAGFQTAFGDPICARGLYRNGACCAESCGPDASFCGGSGCSTRPGGAAACCTGRIKNDGQSCLINEAPCAVPAGAR